MPDPYPVIEASDLGRFEPTPYDLGITDDPDASWSAFPGLIAATADPDASLAARLDAAEAELEAGL